MLKHSDVQIPKKWGRDFLKIRPMLTMLETEKKMGEYGEMLEENGKAQNISGLRKRTWNRERQALKPAAKKNNLK